MLEGGARLRRLHGKKKQQGEKKRRKEKKAGGPLAFRYAAEEGKRNAWENTQKITSSGDAVGRKRGEKGKRCLILSREEGIGERK